MYVDFGTPNYVIQEILVKPSKCSEQILGRAASKEEEISFVGAAQGQGIYAMKSTF